jgi:hypothetical protein
MAVNINFFSWLREGVKHSVLLGVSDAVDHLGTPREGDPIHQRLTAFLQAPEGGSSAPRLTDGSSRRKLGRTLQDIHADAPAKPAA